jgi:hypothetical protein
MPADLKTRLADASASVEAALREIDALQERIRTLETERDRVAAKFREQARRNAVLLSESAGLRVALTAPAPAPAAVSRPGQRPLPPAEPERIKLPPDFPSQAVNLGLDFGTNSTKLIFQGRNDEQRNWVPFLDAPCENDGCPPFAIPSLVRLSEDGRLWFGREAFKDRGGQLFRSLKVDLLPPSETGQWQKPAYPTGLTPQLLVACYLSWVLGRVKGVLSQRLDDRFFLAIAAPMNHVEDERLLESYLPIVHAAWIFALGKGERAVLQGDELAALRPRFEGLFGLPVPSLKERRFIIFPETLAPMVSRMQDADSEEGLRLMVDMGAGTTEYSVSKITAGAGETSIACYADRSILLGGDQFNALDSLPGSASDRAAKEEKLLSEMLLEFRRTFHSGYEKDMNGGRSVRQRWAELEVMLSGGGLHRSGLEEAIRGDNLPARHNLDNPRYSVVWHSPRNLLPIGEPKGFKFDEKTRHFLAVAHGLALPRAKWPKFAFPAEVVTLQDGFVEKVWWKPAYHEDNA